MANPVISALTYTVTDTTIVAVWTTDISADSNLFAGAKAAIDNGVAASGTSHQCIVTGLLPNTVYSCHVVSGATTGSSSNVTTKPSQNRLLVTGGTMGAITTVSNAPQGDTYRSLVSNDNNTYMTQDDGFGFVAGTPNASYNTQIGLITNETTMAGTLVSLANYGGANNLYGTDGPAGAAMGAKSTGLFGINGNLHAFVYRQFPPTYSTNRYCNWIKSTNHGSTWNNFTDKATFTAAGNVWNEWNTPGNRTPQFYSTLIGKVSPVLYAADDGTLGYNTAGQQIDGGNAYVYCHYYQDAGNNVYLLRIPRIQFDAQTSSAFEYWIGPASPTAADFTNDSYWTVTQGTETVVLAQVTGTWVQVAFVPGINSYILTTWQTGDAGGTKFVFYSAPTPAGPWTLFFTQQNPTSHSQWYGPFPFHRDCLANALTDRIPVKVLYQGEPGGGNYKPNWSTLTLLTTTTIPTNTFVQGLGGAGGTTFPGNVTSGNLLTAAVRSTAAITNITDNLGDSVAWTRIASVADGGGSFGMWAYKFAGVTGPCTLTITGAGAFPILAEYHGPTSVRGTPPVMKQVVGTAPASNTTVTLTGDLLLGIGEQSAGGTTPVGAGSGFTVREQGTFTTNTFVAIEDRLNASGGTVVADWTGWGGAGAGGTYGVGSFYAVPATQYSISGSAGIAGATVSYTGAASGSVIADASGNYSIPNLYAGAYTITPSLTAYSFSPVNSAQTITNANITGVNFTATNTPVATPTFSPVAGSYSGTQTVTISSTDSGLSGFAMYYTTDGSTPTTGSTHYTTPVTVASSLTLKAIAVATGYANSAVGSAAYTISGGGAVAGQASVIMLG